MILKLALADPNDFERETKLPAGHRRWLANFFVVVAGARARPEYLSCLDCISRFPNSQPSQNLSPMTKKTDISENREREGGG